MSKFANFDSLILHKLYNILGSFSKHY